MLSEVLIFFDKCVKSKLSKALRFQQTPRRQQKPDYKHIHTTQSIALS